MTARPLRIAHSLGLSLMLASPLACFEDPTSPGGSGADETGDGEGDPGDGDGDPGDGDGDPGDGDGDPGDGDGDPGDGDGEGESWQARRRVEFVNAFLDDGLLEFPVLVRLNAGRIEYGIMQADGSDLRFYDRNLAPLAYEIERWNPNGESFVWVRIPEIDANDDHFFMDYGNPAAADAQDPPAVWADHYLAVWHLADDPATGVVRDSSGNHDGVIAPGGDINSTTGRVGPGMVFGGSDRIEVPHAAALDLTTTVVLEGWANPETTASSYRHILDKGGGNSPYTLQASICCAPISGLTLRNEANLGFNASVDHIAAGQWTHMVGVWTNESKDLFLYVDGDLETTSEFSGLVKTNTEPLGIGTNLVGVLDEVRLAAVRHSSAWIAAQHATMTDQMLSFGPATPLP